MFDWSKTDISAALDELRVPKFMSDLKDKKANKGAKTFFTSLSLKVIFVDL